MTICLVICESAYSQTAEVSKQTFVSESFGFMIVDSLNLTVDIFKNCPHQRNDTGYLEPKNVARCKIIKSEDRFYQISTLYPYSGKDLGMIVRQTLSDSPASIRIQMKVPSEAAKKCYVCVYPSTGSFEPYGFSSDGVVEFEIKKSDFMYDNFFSLCLLPIINPFEQSTSWGDNETLSFLDLQIESIIDIINPKLAGLKLDIRNLSEDVFDKWIIIEEFVLKHGNNQILWRGHIFEKKE